MCPGLRPLLRGLSGGEDLPAEEAEPTHQAEPQAKPSGDGSKEDGNVPSGARPCAGGVADVVEGEITAGGRERGAGGGANKALTAGGAVATGDKEVGRKDRKSAVIDTSQTHGGGGGSGKYEAVSEVVRPSFEGVPLSVSQHYLEKKAFGRGGEASKKGSVEDFGAGELFDRPSRRRSDIAVPAPGRMDGLQIV